MRSSRPLPVVAGLGAAGLALALLPPTGAAARGDAPAVASTTAATAPSAGRPVRDRADAVYDVNAEPAARAALAARDARSATRPSAALRRLRASLGREGVVRVDPLTNSLRQVARTDGFLTGPSDLPAPRVALDYVRAHRAAFGLDAAALQALTLRRDYVDVAGTHHLSWVQEVDGVPVFGRGLQAHVTRDGRLVAVQGAPLGDVADVEVAVRTGAGAARAAAARSVGAPADGSAGRAATGARRPTTFPDGDRAELTLYPTTGGVRPAWQVQLRVSPSERYLAVVDAGTGQVLHRRNLVQHSTALVWDTYPGAGRGGRQRAVDITKRWTSRRSQRLIGPYAHVFTDVNDDDRAQASEEVTFRAATGPRFPFRPFPRSQTPCTAAFPCSWDPARPGSWRTNRGQAGTQLFFYVNTFHDHLAAAPIGFTARAGSFEGADRLQAQALDGANLAGGLPAATHVDNAFMYTPPDGRSPVMGMYLWHAPGARYPDGDPFIAANGADAADIVYHEYTHGLSNRLVVDANGVTTLGDVQAGAMGEGWSDWYAIDYLVRRGLMKDTPSAGELRVGRYVTAGGGIRSQPLDCPAGSTSRVCPGTAAAGRGGYTYGDFGKVVASGPDVHADGEIWAQTLWDLRTSLGYSVTAPLVTRAMELSPANPSFLDERNAILMADQVVHRGRYRSKIWSVFARRGMGWAARTTGGDDTAPVQDFSLPPAAGGRSGA